MTERSRSALVIVLTIFFLVIAYIFFLRPFIDQQPQVEGILNARSTWTVTMQEYVSLGALSSQTYRITNDDGKITMFYSATNRRGTVTKQFTVPIVGPAATFFFEELRADGIWELDDKALRPHSRDMFVVEVEQTLGDEGGSRAFSFSDPDYWATTNAKEFRLLLNPKANVKSSIGARTAGEAGRALKDDRYLKVVNLFRHFGPASVLDAENVVRRELAATDARGKPSKASTR